MSIRLHTTPRLRDNEDKELLQAKAAPPDFTTMDPWQGLLDWLAGPVLGERCIGRGDLDLLRLVDAPAEAAETILANSREHGWIP